MHGSKLAAILRNMDSVSREWMTGRNTADPLTEGFSKRRVVHSGVKGRPIPANELQGVWKEAVNCSACSGRQAVYIHIPFCRHRCLYCGFFQNVSQEELETAYVDRLIKELAMNSEAACLQNSPVNAVFLGGGTPSTLSPANAGRLLNAIHTYLPLANDYELTLEGRIADLIPAKIEAWLAGGVNRFSIGVQSFNTAVRRSVGRLDDEATILERLGLLSSYKQAVVIIDLIYGLPGQDWSVWKKDLQCLTQAPVDGADLYQLNVFPDSALQQAIGTGRIPAAAPTAEQARMFAAAVEMLPEYAFSRVSICHWGKNRRERNLYNTLTKEGCQVIPYGAGAGGKVAGYTLFLTRNVDQYLQAIDNQEKPIAGMMNSSPDDAVYSFLQGQLEQGYIDLEAAAARFGDDLFELKGLLLEWERHGLAEQGKRLARLTVAGQFWYNNLGQALLECLELLQDRNADLAMQPIAAQG